MTQEEQAAADKAAADALAQKEAADFAALPASAQAEIKRLRSENASRRVGVKTAEEENAALRTQLDAFNAEKKKADEANGQFKTLYEKEAAETARLKKVEEENKALKAHFQAQLDAALDGVDPAVKSVIESSNVSIAEKLAAAQKLKTGKGDGHTESPAARRPGGASFSVGDLIKRYQEARTAGQRANVLTEAKSHGAAVYDQVRAVPV